MNFAEIVKNSVTGNSIGASVVSLHEDQDFYVALIAVKPSEGCAPVVLTGIEKHMLPYASELVVRRVNHALESLR